MTGTATDLDVVVEPAEFRNVDFDAAEIAAVVRTVATEFGVAGPITVTVDESTPLGFSELVSVDPIHITVESGALEDPRVLRTFSPSLATDVIGRHLLRARDRLDPAFGDPPADADLDLCQRSAWDTYTVGRLARAGHGAQRQRRVYQFRTRHGFTDAADRAFEALWHGVDLTWADIEKLSADAAAQNPGRLSR